MNSIYILANWKMNANRNLVAVLCKSANETSVLLPKHIKQILFPPFPYMDRVYSLLDRTVQLGAQNCHTHPYGAFTGEVSAKMLKELGVSHVIIGHSERRQYFSESHEFIKAKIAILLEEGLTPVLCIGESLDQRNSQNAEQIVTKQMLECLPESVAGLQEEQILLAYEPIWAIGSGLTPEISDIERMHQALHEAQLSRFGKAFPVVYGGSVNEHNARDILKASHVRGVLVGGASLKPEAFATIAKAAI